MEKVLDIDSLYKFREAVKILKDNGIQCDKKMLLNNPEVCVGIIKIVEYHDRIFSEHRKEQRNR